jgi:hypothetical protein
MRLRRMFRDQTGTEKGRRLGVRHLQLVSNA